MNWTHVTFPLLIPILKLLLYNRLRTQHFKGHFRSWLKVLFEVPPWRETLLNSYSGSSLLSNLHSMHSGFNRQQITNGNVFARPQLKSLLSQWRLMKDFLAIRLRDFFFLLPFTFRTSHSVFSPLFSTNRLFFRKGVNTSFSLLLSLPISLSWLLSNSDEEGTGSSLFLISPSASLFLRLLNFSFLIIFVTFYLKTLVFLSSSLNLLVNSRYSVDIFITQEHPFFPFFIYLTFG